jgi:hypothetical protein
LAAPTQQPLRFVRADGRSLPVPAHRPIKPIYIRKFVELIDGA